MSLHRHQSKSEVEPVTNRSHALSGGAAMAIGPTGDMAEQQADRAADQVVFGRKSANSSLGMATEQRQPDPTMSAQTSYSAADAVQDAGHALPSQERAFFEPRFGRDLGSIRLHTGTAAQSAAQHLQARAYTFQNHIAFAPGQNAPNTRSGRWLMAHEISHALNDTSKPEIRRKPFSEPLGFEEEDRTPQRPERGLEKRGPRRGSLSYREAKELSYCIKMLGPNAAHECASHVTGQHVPPPAYKDIAGITSPVPFEAEVSKGVATHKIGKVTLTILPDGRSTDTKVKGATSVHAPALKEGQNLVDTFSRNGKIVSFKFNIDLNSLTVQTKYGPGINPDEPAGYGRGKAEDDQRRGTTSLKFHEGRHGIDIYNFIEANPYPVFSGRKGMKTEAFNAEATRFNNAVQAYVKRLLQASELSTDCAGSFTIDDHNASEGNVTAICTP